MCPPDGSQGVVHSGLYLGHEVAIRRVVESRVLEAAAGWLRAAGFEQDEARGWVRRV